MTNQRKYYTGVGSRKIPVSAANVLKQYAKFFSDKYICRTGDAVGSDAIFRAAAKPIEVYSPKDVIDDPQHWSYREVQLHMPNDRSGFMYWKPWIRALLARNMMQVLGKNGDQRSEFLVCYAPSTSYYDDSSSGGTGYAIRCALYYGIPVYNIWDEKQKTEFELLNNLLEID